MVAAAGVVALAGAAIVSSIVSPSDSGNSPPESASPSKKPGNKKKVASEQTLEEPRMEVARSIAAAADISTPSPSATASVSENFPGGTPPPEFTASNVLELVREGNQQACEWLLEELRRREDETNPRAIALQEGRKDFRSVDETAEERQRRVQRLFDEFGISEVEYRALHNARTVQNYLRNLENPPEGWATPHGTDSYYRLILEALNDQSLAGDPFQPLFLLYMGKSREELQDFVREVIAYARRIEYGRETDRTHALLKTFNLESAFLGE